MKLTGHVLALCIGCALTAGADAQQKEPTPVLSPMSQLFTQFQAGHPPSPREILGRWILVLNINTERFLTGKAGPDHVLNDPNGVRDVGVTGRPYWELTITRGSNGELVGASRTTWQVDDVSPLVIDAATGMTFKKDYGGDSPYPYRCRMASSDRLICVLDRSDPGHGVEFRRMKANQRMQPTAFTSYGIIRASGRRG
jgi:hypothetical protein